MPTLEEMPVLARVIQSKIVAGEMLMGRDEQVVTFREDPYVRIVYIGNAKGFEYAYAIPKDREIPKTNEYYPAVAYDPRRDSTTVIRASNILPNQLKRRLNSVVNEIYIDLITQNGKVHWIKVAREDTTREVRKLVSSSGIV